MDPSTALVFACTGAALLWLTLALVVVVGRAGYDLRVRSSHGGPTLAPRRARRLVQRARRHRTETGRWRRAEALVELARADSSRARPPLFRAALADADPDVRSAAVRALGMLGGRAGWARELLVEALCEERAPRSRVAAHLEHLEPRVGPLLVPLLADERAAVRYWAAILLARYKGVADAELEALVDDADPAVRRAAIESLGERGDRQALPAVVWRLGDEVMFVRAHACRSAGKLGGLGVAPRIIPLLGDEVWWVRAAAKDALRAMGPSVAPFLIPVLDEADRFARNGAAEVLQDVGFIDELLRTQPDSALLQRIFAAGEHGLRAAAHLRVSTDGAPPVERASSPDREAA